MLIFGSILDPFFLGFRSSLGGLKSEKMQTVSRENHFFENVVFFCLWSSGPKMGPKMVSKRGPKSDKKMVHKIIQKLSKKWSQHGSQHDKKSVRPKRLGPGGLPKNHLLRRCSQDGFKIAQDSFKQPKIDPLLLKKRSKLAQTWTQGAPRSQP